MPTDTCAFAGRIRRILWNKTAILRKRVAIIRRLPDLLCVFTLGSSHGPKTRNQRIFNIRQMRVNAHHGSAHRGSVDIWITVSRNFILSSPDFRPQSPFIYIVVSRKKGKDKREQKRFLTSIKVIIKMKGFFRKGLLVFRPAFLPLCYFKFAKNIGQQKGKPVKKGKPIMYRLYESFWSENI